MADDDYKIGQSKVRSYRTCRQAYHFKYEQRIVRRRVRRPFMFGKLIHRMIEAQAQGEDPHQVLSDVVLDDLPMFEAEREMYGDIVADIGVIMTDYFEYHKDGLRFIPVKDETGEYRYAEHEFSIPLADIVDADDRERSQGISFQGQVDGLGKTANGLRGLVENKSFDKLPSDDERWRNVQSVVYIRAVKHLGWMKVVDGTCWNYVMSKSPTVPQLLKDGTRLSIREITTLPSVVRAALKVHGLSEESHEELMLRAEASRHNYFQRVFTPVSRVVADNVFNGFVETAVEMRDNRHRRDKNIGRHCTWCDYEPLCRTQLTGGDEEFVMRTEFVEDDPEGYRRSKRSNKLKVVK